jgi:hypothetical protein
MTVDRRHQGPAGSIRIMLPKRDVLPFSQAERSSGGVEIRLGCRSTVFVYRFYAHACGASRVLVGLRSKTSLGKEPVIYGLARIFQICGEFLGNQFEVVRSLGEAYYMVGPSRKFYAASLSQRDSRLIDFPLNIRGL